MGLIDQEQIVSRRSLSEKSPKKDVRIKNIIVITYDHIGKQRHIQ